MKMQLDTKGLEYRGVILSGMVRALGEPAIDALMGHDRIRSLINAAAQSAANAPSVEIAGAVAVAVITKVVEAVDEAAAGIAR